MYDAWICFKITNFAFSGVKIRLQPKLALMDLSKATVLKVDQPLEDTQERLLPISLNMVECLLSQDLNQPDRWLTSNPQASFLVNKAAMGDLLLNHPVNMAISKWLMAALLALVVMAVVSRLPMRNGAHLLLKALATASVVTKVDFFPLNMNDLTASLIQTSFQIRPFRVVSRRNSGCQMGRGLLTFFVFLHQFFPSC
jgi:hypothetical protein